jgi:hypothetical protein
VQFILEFFEQFVADIAKLKKDGKVQQDSNVDTFTFLPAVMIQIISNV